MELKFMVNTRLEPSEEKFAEKVIWRGEKEGHWYVNRFTAGGSRIDRGRVGGLDFIVHDQESGVQLGIEFKETVSPTFTPMQWLRFRKGKDTSKDITRLCIIHPSKIKNFATKVCFWSPHFFQTLPLNAFKDMPYAGNSKFLRWQGLGPYLEKYRENNLFDIIGGEFGYTGVNYKLIPINATYDFLYQKLIYDIRHPLNETQQEYRPCELQRSLGDRIKSDLLTVLNNSYRPMYAEDFIPFLRNNFADYITYKASEALIKKVKATAYIHSLLTDMESIEIFSLENYRNFSYGLKKFHNNYILLEKAPSKFLDLLKFAWEKTRERKFTLKELVSLSTRYSTHDSMRSNVPRYRKDLENIGLVEYKLHSGVPPEGVFTLTDKCMNYFTWLCQQNS